jgi:hypothetical protein
LPQGTGEVLAAVAALSHPTPAVAARLAGGDGALGPALAEHVLELDGDVLRFAHPLLAAAAYEAVDPLRRRRLHRRLAALVDDEDERARLLALAAEGPDEEVAGALEGAATRAQLRGLSATAAQLCEQARRLTPAGRSRSLPRWPLHPQPVTQQIGSGRVIPKPPTWPLNPQPIPPPANLAQANIAGRHVAGFDWGSAGIGAGATLVALAITLVMAVVMRRGIARARL